MKQHLATVQPKNGGAKNRANFQSRFRRLRLATIKQTDWIMDSARKGEKPTAH
jgi:hypothetical protein